MTLERDRGKRRGSRSRMPWTQTDPVTERQKFVKLVLKKRVTMIEACEQFGISRKTGYKIMARHAELGLAGLADASRAPKRLSPEVHDVIPRLHLGERMYASDSSAKRRQCPLAALDSASLGCKPTHVHDQAGQHAPVQGEAKHKWRLNP